MERDTIAEVADGEERSVASGRCEGYALLDPLGQKIGRIETVFCNLDGDPQYVRTKIGALAARPVLIPVLDVMMDRDRKTLTLR